MAEEQKVPEPFDPDWLKALTDNFTVDDRDPENHKLRIKVTDPVSAVQTIEQLAGALITFYEGRVGGDLIVPNLKMVRGYAGDVNWFLIDEGDHG